MSESLVPDRVLTGQWPQTFRLALLEKDVGIAQDLLREAAVPGPVVGLAGGLIREARTELGGNPDYLEAIRWIEKKAGVEIRG